MGVQIDAVNNKDSEYISAVEAIKQLIAPRARKPLHWYDTVFNMTPTGRKCNSYITTAHAFTDKVHNIYSNYY